jgi:cyclophilin family peptidyl-prolyl cis-trans isomerase
MPSAKRERQREGRQARAAAAAAEQKRRQRFRSVRNFVIIVVVIIAAIFVLSRRGGDDKKPVTAGSSSGSNSSSSAAPPSVSITIPAPGATVTGDAPCPAADGSSARATTFAKPPPLCINPSKTYTAQVDTTKGAFTIALDAKGTPATANNFVFLARYHYYDGVAFHRIIPDFVDQVGDANGPTPGQGGPGYKFADELPTGASPYTEGTVAMANSGANTNGSQWFVVIGSGGSKLQPSFNRIGTLSAGLDVAKAINATGTQAGTPTEEILITKVTITET